MFNSGKRILAKLHSNGFIILRCLATTETAAEPNPENFSRRMKGWQLHSYGNLDEDVQLSTKLRIPAIKNCNEVLIKVKSSAVNPIDVAMIDGYGAKLLNKLRNVDGGIEFPLVIGREFYGQIAQKGHGGCDKELKIGDNVWGVVPVHQQGCHAEYVVVPQTCISHAPSEISEAEAGATLYAGLTAWSGLFISGGLGGIAGSLTSSGGGKGKRVLVLGAAGGVGTIAVQILKAEGAKIVASCSTDAVPVVQGLGAHHVIDYTQPDHQNEFIAYSPYDIILDCAGLGPAYAQKFSWNYKTFVTFSSPLLKNVDKHGLPYGLALNVKELVENNLKSLTNSRGCVKWGYFIPAQQGIQYLKKLVERKKLLPLIDSSYKFGEILDAYRKVNDGHLRGKVVVTYS